LPTAIGEIRAPYSCGSGPHGRHNLDDRDFTLTQRGAHRRGESRAIRHAEHHSESDSGHRTRDDYRNRAARRSANAPCLNRQFRCERRKAP